MEPYTNGIVLTRKSFNKKCNYCGRENVPCGTTFFCASDSGLHKWMREQNTTDLVAARQEDNFSWRKHVNFIHGNKALMPNTDHR